MIDKLRTLFLFIFVLELVKCTYEREIPLKNKLIEKDKKTKQHLPITDSLVLGKYDYHTHPFFKLVPDEFSHRNIYVQKEVCDSFIRMAEFASKQNLKLYIVSGTRSFNEQKRIWEKKRLRLKNLTDIEKSEKILEYSSMPSTSRHHWGTDIDINSVEESYFEKPRGKKIYEWLSRNAHSFGFYQPYTNKINKRTGYKEEKWHWSYKPLSDEYLKYYNKNITYQDINNFKGSETAKALKVIKDYVNGIE